MNQREAQPKEKRRTALSSSSICIWCHGVVRRRGVESKKQERKAWKEEGGVAVARVDERRWLRGGGRLRKWRSVRGEVSSGIKGEAERRTVKWLRRSSILQA
jgi:hypothetical protein